MPSLGCTRESKRQLLLLSLARAFPRGEGRPSGEWRITMMEVKIQALPLKMNGEGLFDALLGGKDCGVLLLGNPEEEVGVITAATGFKENAVTSVVIERRGARENP